MLIYTTIMVLSQEPFRRASLSKSAGDSRLHWRKVINLFWISFPFVVLLAVGVGVGWAFLLRLGIRMVLKNSEWTLDNVHFCRMLTLGVQFRNDFNLWKVVV